MATTSQVFPKIKNLERSQIAALQRIAVNAQFLADLVHADFFIYCRSELPEQLLIVAEAKPNTMISVQRQPLVGRNVALTEEPLIAKTFAEQRGLIGEREFELGAEVLDQQTTPVFDHIGRLIAVVSLERPKFFPGWRHIEILNRAAKSLMNCLTWETHYANQHFKSIAARDGIMIVDDRGEVVYANPIAAGIYKTMGVGDLSGRKIFGRHHALRLMHRGFTEQVYLEQETRVDELIYVERVLPVVLGGATQCLILTISDVTELRKKERELRIKSAVIQEIHHRVKNNLQTIASLLRMQARRSPSPEVKDALQESINRIVSISVVHEFLSQQDTERVDVVAVTKSILRLILSSITEPGFELETVFEGQPVLLPSSQATSVALVITELAQNTVEHGFKGRKKGMIRVSFEELPQHYRFVVADDGWGLPETFDIQSSNSLGLHIARTLVEEDLKGTFEMTTDNGAVVTITASKEYEEEEYDGTVVNRHSR